MTAPALLVAARAKYLASPEYAHVATSIGTGPAPLASWVFPLASWVFVDVNPRTGLPDAIGHGKSSVVFYLRPGSWHASDTSARYPKLAATVWAQGEPATRDAEWQARTVAESLISCFNDFASEHVGYWSSDVFVIRSRWSGELSVYEAENIEGTYRAEVSFEVETV